MAKRYPAVAVLYAKCLHAGILTVTYTPLQLGTQFVCAIAFVHHCVRAFDVAAEIAHDLSQVSRGRAHSDHDALDKHCLGAVS